MKYLFSFLPLLMAAGLAAQDGNPSPALPYREIPNHPESYTAENVAARMIDGLGFRYYWATEGLRPEDLAFRPGDDARTTGETIDHIHDLSVMVVHAILKKPIVRGREKPALSFEEKRKATLENLKSASDLLKSGNLHLEDCHIVFQNGEETTGFPFWNAINGPVADAIWHCGQVVSFRRSSGNPFNPKVSVFSGKVRE